MNYKVYADSVLVGRSNMYPSNELILACAVIANDQGWNGTVLDVYNDAEWVGFGYPNFEQM